MSCRFAVLPLKCPHLLPLLIVVAACGGDAGEEDAGGPAAADQRQSTVTCGTPALEASSAAPFEWIGVEGVANGFGAVAAEVTAGGDTLLAPLTIAPDGSISLLVPVHPSLRVEGGDVSLRIYADRHRSCETVPLTIAALPPSPGAMADATRELRATLDQIVAPLSSGPLATGLAETDGPLPLFAIPALWALPELEKIERLLAAGATTTDTAGSRFDAELLDAVAGQLRLAERMQGFRQVVLVAQELAGDVTVTPGTRLSALPTPGVEHASMASSLAPLAALGRRLIGPAGSQEPESVGPQEACPAGRSNLFEIAEPEKLDNLMRVQDYAQRFLGGANDDAGGSASGTVFGDLGVFMGVVGMAGKQGEILGEVWDAFSTIVLNTAEAYAGLLPGDMELEVMATPKNFEEDSEEKGEWTARAVAKSDGMKLTQKVIEKVMQKALEHGLADASIGKSLKNRARSALRDETLDQMDGREAVFYNELADRTAGAIDAQAKKAANEALKRFLDALGAKETPDGFDIPAGCWELPDMSASDAPGDGKPPLVTAHLIGESIKFVDDGAVVTRNYEPADTGSTRLEVRTAADYRKSIEWQGGLHKLAGGNFSVATTYAFGGNQYVGAVTLSVLAIEVEVFPSIKKVEPGSTEPFVATVRNAVDKSAKWTASAGRFTEIVDHGDGQHEAMLALPPDPAVYPIRIEVESMSRKGLRKSGQPARLAIGHLQIEDPLIDIRPVGVCVPVDGERQFVAHVLGAAKQSVTWSVRGPGAGRIDANGVFRSSVPGTTTIRAAWTEDASVTAEIDVDVGGDCCFWTASLSGASGIQDIDAYWGTARSSDSWGPPLDIDAMIQEGDPQPRSPWLVINLMNRVPPSTRDDSTEINLAIPGVEPGHTGVYNRVWGALFVGRASFDGNADYLRRDVIGLPEGTGIGRLLTTNVQITRYDEERLEGTFDGRFLDLTRVPPGERTPPGVGIHSFPDAETRATGRFSIRLDQSCGSRGPRVKMLEPR